MKYTFDTVNLILSRRLTSHNILEFFRSDIDSELHSDEKSEVLGVLAADQDGLCLLAQGSIDPALSSLSSNLSKLSKKLEPGRKEVPTIIVESDKR